MKFDASSMLKKINVPVLILEGNEDKLLPTIDSIELYHEIKGAEIDFIPKGRHFVNLERPDLVDKYIYHFLKKNGLEAR